MMVFETRGSNGHLDNDDGRVGEAARVVGAERGLSATAHLFLALPSQTSEQEWKLVNPENRFPFLLSFFTPPLDQYIKTGGRHKVLQGTLGSVWALDNPSLYNTTTGGGGGT